MKIHKRGLYESKTPLGFYDITTGLKKKLVSKIIKFDVIRDVYIEEIVQETYKQKKVSFGIFKSKELNISGRVFPLDEIIFKDKYYDLIVQNLKNNDSRFKFNIDANIYHDLYPNERIIARVSKYKDYDPTFQIFNRMRCFIKKRDNPKVYDLIKEGDIIQTELIGINDRNDDKIFIWVKALNIINNDKFF